MDPQLKILRANVQTLKHEIATDVDILCAKGQTVKAHYYILTANTYGWPWEDDYRINLREYSSEIVQAVVDYLYFGTWEVEPPIWTSNTSAWPNRPNRKALCFMVTIYEFAVHFKMHPLRTMIVDRIRTDLRDQVYKKSDTGSQELFSATEMCYSGNTKAETNLRILFLREIAKEQRANAKFCLENGFQNLLWNYSDFRSELDFMHDPPIPETWPFEMATLKKSTKIGDRAIPEQGTAWPEFDTESDEESHSVISTEAIQASGWGNGSLVNW